MNKELEIIREICEQLWLEGWQSGSSRQMKIDTNKAALALLSWHKEEVRRELEECLDQEYVGGYIQHRIDELRAGEGK